MWGASDPADLSQTWAETLAGYRGEDLRDALDAMRSHYLDYPPTLYQFADLCRDARLRRAQKAVALPPPRTRMPAHIAEQLREFIAAHKVSA